jgi:adenylate cyclase
VDLCLFSMVAARLVKRVDAGALRTAPRRAWRGQTDNTAWINAPGPPGTLRAIPAADLLSGRVPPRALRGKLVVIGVTQGKEDLHQTPFAKKMRGAEVQADSIATILDGAPLRDVSALIDLALVLALAAVAPLAALLLRSRLAIIAVILAAAVAFLLAAYLAFVAGRVVSVVIPLTALLLGAAGALVAELALRPTRAPRDSDAV